MAMLMFNGSSELVTDQNETGMGQAGVVGIVQPSGNFISSSSVCFCLNSRPDDLGGEDSPLLPVSQVDSFGRRRSMPDGCTNQRHKTPRTNPPVTGSCLSWMTFQVPTNNGAQVWSV